MTEEPIEKTNGAEQQPGPMNGEQQVRMNPVEVAQLALMFLARADMKRHEWENFNKCQLFLSAIAEGRVNLVEATRQ